MLLVTVTIFIFFSLDICNFHFAEGSSQMASIYEDLYKSPSYQVLISPIYQTRISSDEADPNLVTLSLPGTSQVFQCRFGSPDTNPVNRREVNLSDPTIRHETIKNALTQLEPLRKSGCLFYNQGWWTIEFCYGSHIRQFHNPASPKEAQDPKVKTEYILGRFKHSLSDRPTTSLHNSVIMEAPKDGTRYLRQKYVDGSLCDLTNQPRSVDVEFHCAHPADHIVLHKETATCQYLLVVHTPRLCREAAFLAPQSTRPTSIHCHPIQQSPSSSSVSNEQLEAVESVEKDIEFNHDLFNIAAEKKLGDLLGDYQIPEIINPHQWIRIDLERDGDAKLLVRKPAQHQSATRAPDSLSLNSLEKTLNWVERMRPNSGSERGKVGENDRYARDSGRRGNNEKGSMASRNEAINRDTIDILLEESIQDRTELLVEQLLASLLNDEDELDIHEDAATLKSLLEQDEESEEQERKDGQGFRKDEY